ncbi:unnamed protein product [Darwinula stevensoni]|uniref:RNA 3'-terminal phosphate cyclase-like protein n=1 Tax=Darwinula stevensoni TaxID=69355 RepID=A0A7R8X469_9CRUS|nr:unnamed protein product [Darwinula stevensoni]CAG0878705.1 unnamed protein product [Darwinula stevensoni]
MVPSDSGGRLSFEGTDSFRYRIILSVLTGKPIRIRKIRSEDEDPGLREFEVSFVRLIDKLTNGSKIQISETGTVLNFDPGLITGGNIQHDCNVQRSIGYYLEALVVLGPFSKKSLRVTLRGVTNDSLDPSMDSMKYCLPGVLKNFLNDDEGLSIKVNRRGLPPDGGGEVVFMCPVARFVKPIQLTDPGKIKRIRGMAYGSHVSPSLVNRAVESAKKELCYFIPDVFIQTHHTRGQAAGKSSGYGLCLCAETNNGCFYTSEALGEKGGRPEDTGTKAAHLLMEEIYRGGCCDSSFQAVVFMLMAFGRRDVSKILIGPLSPHGIECLRLLKTFTQLIFRLESKEEEEDMRKGGPKVLACCLGLGYSNINKTVS